jgi:hypothetical protein
MIRTTFPKDLQVKAANSTPVECFSDFGKPTTLVVTLAEKEIEIPSCNKTFAKTPEGEIVEVAFTSPFAKSTGSIQIVYNIW